MIELVEFRNEIGNRIAINPQLVQAVEPHIHGTTLWMSGDPTTVVVEEPYDTVVDRLTGKDGAK